MAFWRITAVEPDETEHAITLQAPSKREAERAAIIALARRIGDERAIYGTAYSVVEALGVEGDR